MPKKESKAKRKERHDKRNASGLCKRGCGRPVKTKTMCQECAEWHAGKRNNVGLPDGLGAPCAMGCGDIATTKRSKYCNRCRLEAMKESSRKSRLREMSDPEKRDKISKRNRAHWLNRQYGISTEEHASILSRQGNACAICKSPNSGFYRGWHTDHDHITGMVRGILCASCNHMLGKAKDNVGILAAAIEYLNNFNQKAAA